MPDFLSWLNRQAEVRKYDHKLAELRDFFLKYKQSFATNEYSVIESGIKTFSEEGTTSEYLTTFYRAWQEWSALSKSESRSSRNVSIFMGGFQDCVDRPYGSA